jgi:peptidyl-prolyl cis-trans isomerase A (cyclophilin A)
MRTLLQSFPIVIKSAFNTVNKIFLVMLLIPIVMVIWSCTQNQPTQSENEQTKPIQGETKGGNPMVIMSTSLGDIKMELYQDKAPITVQNFLSYVNDGFFDGTIFHRVIPNFMVQGGGFTQDMQQKPTKAPIKNEADNGLKNDVGTIAMARTGVVDSATSQFFINQADNDFLNHGSRDFGYAVFGKVVEGMDVVNKIAGVKTGRLGPFQDVPLEPVLINSVRVVESPGK